MALELWTSPTPNGWKVSIMIEELIEAGIDVGPVEVRTINLKKGEQFEDDFTERNPNQKIPTLRDGARDVIRFGSRMILVRDDGAAAGRRRF